MHISLKFFTFCPPAVPLILREQLYSKFENVSYIYNTCRSFKFTSGSDIFLWIFRFGLIWSDLSKTEILQKCIWKWVRFFQWKYNTVFFVFWSKLACLLYENGSPYCWHGNYFFSILHISVIYVRLCARVGPLILIVLSQAKKCKKTHISLIFVIFWIENSAQSYASGYIRDL